MGAPNDDTEHLVKSASGLLFIMVPAAGGNGKPGSHNLKRMDAIKKMQQRAKKIGVKTFFLYHCNCKEMTIKTDTSFSSCELAREDRTPSISLGPFAFRFSGMTQTAAESLFGKKEVDDVLIERERINLSLKELEDERSETSARDPKIKEDAKKRDSFKCCVSGCLNGFLTQSGEQFIEVHHIQPLKEGGKDVLSNVICLCSHHHSQVHYADEEGRKFVERAIHEAMEKKIK